MQNVVIDFFEVLLVNVAVCPKYVFHKHFIHCFEKTTSNPQEMWKTINKLLNKKSKTTIISEIKTENGSFTDPKEITNVLNEYFCNIGCNLAQNLESTSVQPSSYVDQRETEFKLDPVTEAELSL